MYLEVQKDETFAQAFIRELNNDLNDVKRSFIKIGFRLKEADEFEYYKELGYKNIVELAEAEFGFKSSTTYEFMKVYELAHDPDCRWHIAEKYDKYSYSQLLALTYLKHSVRNAKFIVKPTDSVRKIKRFVSIWNHEAKLCSNYDAYPINTVDEYLKAYDKEHPKEPEQISEYVGQLPGQIAMELTGSEELAEGPNDEQEEEFSERSEKFKPEIAVKEETVAPLADGKLIEYVLKQGTPFIDGKYRILDFYNLRQPPMGLFKNYVMTQYGSGYFMGTKHYKRVEYNRNDLTIMRANGGKLVLTWGVVAGNISRLITANKYLSDKEKDEYLKWKVSKQKLTSVTEIQQGQNQQSEEFSERSEKVNVGQTNLSFLKNACCIDFAKYVSKCICELPDEFGAGMPYEERVRAWLFNWLLQTFEEN